jgi:hypothetical protein
VGVPFAGWGTTERADFDVIINSHHLFEMSLIKLRHFKICLIDVTEIVLRRVRKIAKRDYYILHVSLRLSVSPPIRMEKLGSHWTDFHGILHLSIFRKSVLKTQV